MENKLTSFIFDKVGVGDYNRLLDLTSLRHRLISANVANVSTPGYRSGDIDFKGELARIGGETKHLAGTTTDPDHIPLGEHSQRSPKVDRDRVESGEVNSVNIDEEVPKMAQNELVYTTAARLLQKKFSALHTAITSE